MPPATPVAPGGVPISAPSTPIRPPGTAAPTATATRAPAGALSAEVTGELQPLAFTLNGREQIARTTLRITVSDDTAAAQSPGWTLSLTMAQFRVAGQQARTLPPDAVTLLGVTIECAGGACAMPENTIAYPRVIPAGAAVPIVVAAPGSGSGQFTITPIFAVTVPGNAYSGDYTTAIAVDIAR